MKISYSSNPASSQPRTDARPSKIRALTPVQRETLLRWLSEDKVIYAVAKARLQKDFGVVLAISTISRFWQAQVQPNRPAQDADVLLDVVIQSAAPVRLIVKRKGTGVTVAKIQKAGADSEI